MCVRACVSVCACVCLYLSIYSGLIIATWSDVIQVRCAWCFAELPSVSQAGSSKTSADTCCWCNHYIPQASTSYQLNTLAVQFTVSKSRDILSTLHSFERMLWITITSMHRQTVV